jgi:hypothetical protein
MQPIVIAATPLAYADYKKLIFADLRVRHPFLYIGLPIILFIPLIIIAVMIADAGIAAIMWKDVQTLVLMSGASVMIWVATWYSVRRNYFKTSTLRNGTVYRLDEQGITRETPTQELVLWSDIARTGKQSGQWILLRQAALNSNEFYILDTAGVMPPASRVELLNLLKSKRIKPI